MKLENPAALARPTITIPPPPKEEPVHPFVRAMAAMGEAIGRDAGILALAAVQNTKNGIDAVLYWDGANAPDAIKEGLPPDVAARLHSAFIVPPGKELPAVSNGYRALEALERQIADGSRAILFLIPAAMTEAKGSPVNDDLPVT